MLLFIKKFGSLKIKAEIQELAKNVPYGAAGKWPKIVICKKLLQDPKTFPGKIFKFSVQKNYCKALTLEIYIARPFHNNSEFIS